jgi:hypothetical protein
MLLLHELFVNSPMTAMATTVLCVSLLALDDKLVIQLIIMTYLVLGMLVT